MNHIFTLCGEIREPHGKEATVPSSLTPLPHLPCQNPLLTSLWHGIIPSLHSSDMEKKKSYGALTRTFFASRNCKVAMQRVGSFKHVLLTRHNTAINSCSKCNLGLELLWQSYGITMATVPLGTARVHWAIPNLENNFGMEISFGSHFLCETSDSLFNNMLENVPTPKRGSSWEQQVCENAESYM